MKLENIGFYTLCDGRAYQTSETSPMWRCEMILTNRCNFKCPYCRGLRNDCLGDMEFDKAMFVLDQWIDQGLKNVRFSGGEPTIYPRLVDLVARCKEGKVEHIAISSNGSAPTVMYQKLLDAGANDFSISLDACCASFADKMAGVNGKFQVISDNIKYLSAHTYVTVGIVLTEDNVDQVKDIVEYAHNLGVADIRVISAAQYGSLLKGVIGISEEILNAHPILKYRVNNIKNERNVRSLQPGDSHRCWLIQDDSVVCGDYHFPCVIYMREHGEPIGKIGPNMRAERVEWGKTHDTHKDPICLKNCLDVCIDYNNKCRDIHYGG
jgi:molybdenum cofactor biosynthesis enzyme MoaA